MNDRGQSAEDRIRDLFAAMLQVESREIVDETTPESVPGWDSIQHLMLVSGFEEEFGVDLDPEEAVEMYKDFATFKRIVLQKLATTR